MSYGKEYVRGWERCGRCGLIRPPGTQRMELWHGVWQVRCTDDRIACKTRAHGPTRPAVPGDELEVLP